VPAGIRKEADLPACPPDVAGHRRSSGADVVGPLKCNSAVQPGQQPPARTRGLTGNPLAA